MLFTTPRPANDPIPLRACQRCPCQSSAQLFTSLSTRSRENILSAIDAINHAPLVCMPNTHPSHHPAGATFFHNIIFGTTTGGMAGSWPLGDSSDFIEETQTCMRLGRWEPPPENHGWDQQATRPSVFNPHIYTRCTLKTPQSRYFTFTWHGRCT